jgi:N-acetylneuraminate synthase
MSLSNFKNLVGNYKKPYIIAEVNSSHFGSIETAKKMIEVIAEIGCNCVKFQSWTSDTLYSSEYYDSNPIAKRFVNKFSFNEEQLKELSKYSISLGIHFASTPYSIDEAKFLINQCNVPFIKIASMEINNLKYLRELAELQVPLILSTGMAEFSEIDIAVNEILKTGNDSIIILHCVSLYPLSFKDANLKNIITLQKHFKGLTIGYSDHTERIEASVAAVGLGASVIEKHFTLDKSLIGMDNQMALEKSEFKELVTSCKNTFLSLGSFDRKISKKEYEQRENMRRSIVSSKNLKKGHILTAEDLDVKRPGNGIPANELQNLIGKKLKNDIKKDYLIYSKDLQ